MNIVVYTKNSCPQCSFTKKELDKIGVLYSTININEISEEEADKVITYIKDELGFSSMPVVVAEGHEPFSGFQPEKIKKLKEDK